MSSTSIRKAPATGGERRSNPLSMSPPPSPMSSSPAASSPSSSESIRVWKPPATGRGSRLNPLSMSPTSSPPSPAEASASSSSSSEVWSARSNADKSWGRNMLRPPSESKERPRVSRTGSSWEEGDAWSSTTRTSSPSGKAKPETQNSSPSLSSMAKGPPTWSSPSLPPPPSQANAS
uniref:Uncharacterized protein n=1 Tax=Arundo donax TaxID=35708 RepID=A0A0A8YKZ8_ARUDO